MPTPGTATVALKLKLNPLNFGARLLSAAVLALTSCSSPPPPPATAANITSGAAYETRADIAGDTTIHSVTTTNTIVSINPKTRTIELKHADGHVTSYRVDPGVTNFDAIKVGDLVKSTVVEERAVDIRSTLAPESTASHAYRIPVANGAMPAVKEIETYKFTAKILAIDPWLDRVTLQLAGGRTRTIAVSEYVNLANMNVGDDVTVTMTQATTLALEKP
jgi:hypothetical protein